jgi:hypothetical protein
VAELMAVHCLNNIENFSFDVLLFLVCFVALQVMMKGAWSVSL